MAQLWPEQISDYTVSRALKKIGFTRKKSYGYKQRNEIERTAFVKLELENIVCADESGMDGREGYDYGYSPTGDRLYDLKSGNREGRVNMIAALCNHQLLAPFTIKGACNRVVFETWLERCLIPKSKPGHVLVIDNTAFHKCGRIAEMVAATGCEIWYLPPYSPEFNRIERCWSHG